MQIEVAAETIIPKLVLDLLQRNAIRGDLLQGANFGGTPQ
jgi:hypothetical protein